MEIDSIKSVYFIGAGGIGMSALVRYFLSLGKVVAGYDRTSSELTERLNAEGAAIDYDADYPFEVAVQTLEEDTLSCTVSKHSETVYKCEIYPLKKGVNHINVCILEDGCPPSVFPFEITYIPPVLVEEKGEVRVVEEEKVEFVKKELPRKKSNAKRNNKPQIPMTDFLQ